MSARERLARDLAQHMFEVRAAREPDPTTVDELAAMLLDREIPCICWSDLSVREGMERLHAERDSQ
jgi:hypothetical protein